MNILLVILNLISFLNHDIQIAHFKVYSDASELKLDVKLEFEDLSNELNVEKAQLTLIHFENYLNENLKFKFDDKRSLLKVMVMDSKGEHLIVHAAFSDPPISFRTLDIENTFLHSINEHSNIIALRLKNTERDFLMNRGRTAIQIQY